MRGFRRNRENVIVGAAHFTLDGIVMPEIIDEYLEELEEDLPKVIVVEKNKISQRMYTFLLTHGYTLMWSAEAGNIASDSVYVREK